MSTPSEDLGTASITIELTGENGTVQEAQRLGRRIERELAIAARHAGRAIQRNLRQSIRELGPLEIKIKADTKPFFKDLRRIYTIDDIDVTVKPDSTGFIAALQRQLRGQFVTVRVKPDFTGFDTAIRAHPVPTVNVPVKTDDKALAKFGKALSALGSAAATAGKLTGVVLAIGAVGAAAIQASSALIGLVGALAPLGGIIAALPAVALGAAATFGVLKLATSGMGDAFKAAASGDAKKLEEALKGLAPAAKETVLAVKALAPEFKKLRQSVQQSFFKQFASDIKTSGTNLLGLKKGLGDVAIELGKSAGEAVRFAGSTDAIKPLETILEATATALEGLSSTIAPVLKGFLDVGAAVAKAFGSKTATAITNIGTKFGTYLSVLAASGGAVEKVSKALTTFKELGTVLGNVKSILGSVIQSAQDVSGGLLANLGEITGKVAEFLNSGTGKTALTDIFATIQQLAKEIGPIFTTLITEVGKIAGDLAPIFAVLGPVITNVLEALGSGIQNAIPGILTVVEKLGAALTNIADSGAIEKVGTALSIGLGVLAPLLPVVGQLATTVLPLLAQAFTTVATALEPVINSLSTALLPVLPILGEALSKLITAAEPFLTLFGEILGQVITAAAPLLVTLATGFSGLVTALQPLIEKILPILEPMLTQGVEIFKQLVAAILPMIPATVDLVAALVPFLGKVLEILGPLFELHQGLIGFVALQIIVPVIEGIVTILTGLATAIATAANYVRDFKTNVTRDFNNLKDGVGNALGLMKQVAVAKFNELKNEAEVRVRELKRRVGELLGELPEVARNALSGIGTALENAGRQMIQGMINGVRQQAGALVDAAKGVVSGAINGAKSLLGIHSPSKVFAEIGRFTAQGLINGLTGSVAQVEQTADRLAEAIIKAFKGKSTKTRDALVGQLRTNEKELVRLANRREALAKKIKEANDFAAGVTSKVQQSFGLQQIAADASKAVGGLTIENVTESLDVAVGKIRNFNKQINSLAKKGLNKNLLEQLIGMGPEAGSELAGVLDQASKSDLRELSKVQAQLDKSAKQLGKDSADHLFDAGKEASKGFLAGLEAQQDDIEKLMLSIAKSIQKSIKSALGIKSPSKVMARLGRFAAEGLSVGLDDESRSIRQASLNAVRAVTDPFRGSDRVSINSAGQAVTQAPGAVTNNKTMAPTFYITEAGDAGATAQRVINRLAAAALL